MDCFPSSECSTSDFATIECKPSQGIALYEPQFPPSQNDGELLLYGFCLSSEFLAEYADIHQLPVDVTSSSSPNRSNGDTDVNLAIGVAKARIALDHIRRKVLEQLSKHPANRDMPDELRNNVPICGLFQPPPAYIGASILQAQSELATIPSRNSLWTVIYVATNESKKTLQRVDKAGDVTVALQKVLNCLHINPQWIPEGTHKRFREDLPDWSPYNPFSFPEELTNGYIVYYNHLPKRVPETPLKT
ncbi:unnamed protein product [Somion occarium]|uniref:Uncharacterized protein n=1 Tax=Somion occarium TaxID=3059160 RepID=A0ABP1DFL0_9APHY